ncbi:MAG: sigma factor-like helix-turn-helix DNA-binding protein [Faecalibacterium sp.]
MFCRTASAWRRPAKSRTRSAGPRPLLDGLPARERQIILLRYGLAGQPPLTQLEAGRAAEHQPELCLPP